MAQIIWAPRALNIFESLLDYFAKESPVMAGRFARKFILIADRIDSLASHLFLGNYIAEDNSCAYRQVIQDNYRIIYRTDGIRVFIVAVCPTTRLFHQIV
jgi:toxin ParE1/3/4